MRKILGLVVFSFLLSSNAYSKCVQGNCNNGQGTFTYSGGDKYVGEFKDNKYHGEGTYTFSNGDKYVGEFKDSKYHGEGTYTFSKGITESGYWEKGQLVKESAQSEENNIRRLGGESAVKGLKIQRKMEEYAKACQPLFDTLNAEEKDLCLIIVNKLKESKARIKSTK